MRVAVLASALGVGTAAAQEELGQPIPIGDAALYPSLRVDYLADDNVRLEEDEDERESGSVVIASPSLELVARRRLLELRGRYVGRYAAGSEEPQNFDDHLLGLNVDARLDRRRRVNLDALYRLGHQPFGFGLSEGRTDEIDEPVEYGEYVLGGRFRYGVPDARGNVEAGLRLTGRGYTNFEEFTDGRDFRRLEPYGLFSLRISGDTRALVEVRYADFTEDSGVNDRGAVSLFGGLEFAATGRLRGALRLGATETSYEDERREDVTVAVAETSVRYLIREYATLGLDFDRSLDDDGIRREDGSLAEQAVTDTLTLSWSQEWSSRVSHDAYVRRSSLDRECPSSSSTNLSAGLEIDYAVRRWLSFGASVTGETRDADVCEGAEAQRSDIEFDRRLVGVHVRATL